MNVDPKRPLSRMPKDASVAVPMKALLREAPTTPIAQKRTTSPTQANDLSQVENLLIAVAATNREKLVPEAIKAAAARETKVKSPRF
jgi:hypothetical protein